MKIYTKKGDRGDTALFGGDIASKADLRIVNEDVLQWSSYIVERDMFDDGKPMGVGKRFRTVAADRGNRIEYNGLVTAYEPPCVLALKLTSPTFDTETAYAFESVGRSTRVSQSPVNQADPSSGAPS